MPRRRPISGTYLKANIPPPKEKPQLDVVLVTPTPIDKDAAKEAKRFAKEVARRDDDAA